MRRPPSVAATAVIRALEPLALPPDTPAGARPKIVADLAQREPDPG